MKKMKSLIMVLFSMIMVLGLSACSASDIKGGERENVSTSNDGSHYPVTITTYNYNNEPIEITFNKSPEKVVAVYQNSIETLLALGLENKIVMASGLDHEVKEEYKQAFSKTNYIKDFAPSKEAVIMEQPDFILSWYSLFSDKKLGDVNYWHDNNINTYMSLNSGASKDRTIQNEINDILNLGKIFNVEEKSNEIVNEIKSKINSVSESVKNMEKQNTIVIEYIDGQISTYGKNTLAGDMINSLGAEILNEDGGNIGEEDLINLNPDSIFVVYMDRNDENQSNKSINDILNNKSLASLDAVKNKRVNSIALGEMYCSGVRTIDGINTFANGIYPDLNDK